MYPFDPDPHIPILHPAGAGGPHDHCSPRPSAGGNTYPIGTRQYPVHCREGTWHHFLFIFFVADESPPQQLHRPLSFKEPVIKLTTPSFQSNQTLLLDLIVFQLYWSSRWKIKMLI